MRQLYRCAAFICAAALPALAGAQEMTIVSKVTVNQGAPATSTQYLGAQKVRTTMTWSRMPSSFTRSLKRW